MSSEQHRVPSHCTTAVGNHKPSAASPSYGITAAAERSGDKSQDPTTLPPLKHLTGWNRECVTFPPHPNSSQSERHILNVQKLPLLFNQGNVALKQNIHF